MSARTVLPLVTAVTAVVVLATGCTSTKNTGSGGSGVALVKEGKLTTCTHLPYEPFQFRKDNKVVGFDVDIVDLVAKELGVTQEIVDTPFEGIQTGEDLNAGKCDLAAAGMTITAVREQNLDFSGPYFDATQALIAKKGSPYTSLASLKGKKLGVQQGTTGETYAKKNGAGVETVQFEDVALLLTAVKTGQVDAGINDNGVLFEYVRKNADTAVTAEFDTGEKYGIGVKTGNTALRQEIDKAVKAARADGRYDAIYKKWFPAAPKKQ
ncbi:basic amino acid ABC transporter substrate-binding protein [Streptomyces spiroverticillatus]|uniref:Basic amino acid ABC transporter substrate-binding protein n=1 Tax=Streptomyces finlayi TaxID=67296 RepID=A0A918X5A3_9ACTN|nr:ABC transporter substrate-binding protein [Streptomyces finlayi]GHA35070.1 basic amino acid ABC transporter substrate-binding protein [Streptomyces spiroverticillatus]GHD13094.1 basic amino acid ABC transporter substrate-binding protein [Streptomyces finlayi]